MGREVVDFNHDDATPTNTGQAILAIDIAAFEDPEVFRRRIDALARDLRGSQRMKGVERIWLPGEQSHAKYRDRLENGVPVAPALLSSLNKLAGELGIGALV
jgi:LDH2 family malate/lactate/ureidoglycolate dehydrogenase